MIFDQSHSFFGEIKVDAKMYGTLRDFPHSVALFGLVIQLTCF